MTEVEPEEGRAFIWDDDSEVEFTLIETDDGTRLTVVYTTPSFTKAKRATG